MSTATAPAPFTEIWYPPEIQPRHDWMNSGNEYNADDSAKTRILHAIADIDRNDTGPGEWSRWLRIPDTAKGEPPLRLGAMPGMAIQEIARQFKMPRVTHCGISPHLSPLGFYGVRAHYRKSDRTFHRVELFVVDEGHQLVTVVARVWP